MRVKWLQMKLETVVGLGKNRLIDMKWVFLKQIILLVFTSLISTFLNLQFIKRWLSEIMVK